MMDNFLIDEEETWGKRDVVIPTDAENTTDGICELRGRYNGNKEGVFLFGIIKRK